VQWSVATVWLGPLRGQALQLVAVVWYGALLCAGPGCQPSDWAVLSTQHTAILGADLG